MVRLTREHYVNIALLVLLFAVPFWAWIINQPFTITLASRIAVLALAALGLNIALGLGGMVSFGHALYFGLGGYVAGIMASHAISGEPIFGLTASGALIVMALVAMLVSGLVAALVGVLSLRTSGIFFIMITLAFAQMAFYFALSWPAYGGEDGLPILRRASFPGLNTMRPWEYFQICFAALCLGLGLFALIRASRFGTALMAIRQNPDRAAAVGIDPFRIRLAAFVLSGMITGLAGVLMANLTRFTSPSMLAWGISGELMVMLILGGAGRLFAPLAGAAILVGFEVLFSGFTEHWKLALGLVLLFVVLFARGGLIGALAGRERHG